MEELKHTIRAMVISNAERPMTISQLDKYFKCNEGYCIPYEKYGFKHVDAMLRSMSDAVQLDGLGCSALVMPILSQKSEQIQEMVEKQQSYGKKRKAEPSNFSAKKVKLEPTDSTDFTTKKVKLEPTCCTDFTAKKVKMEPSLCTASKHVGNSNTNHYSRSGNKITTSCLTMADLKKIIHAIVISNAGRTMTVTQLAKDFKYFEGTDIPHRDHGFQHLDAMLRTIPDVVKVNGQGPSALVYPVTTRKSNHIEAMIRRQKTSKGRFNRTSYFSRGTGYNYSTNRRPYDNSQRRWTQNSSRRNGYTRYGNGYNDFGDHQNGNLPCGANNYQSTKPSYGAYGYNSDVNVGYANYVPGHSLHNSNGTEPFHAAFLSFYQAMKCNYEANYIPYNSCRFPLLDTMLKPAWEVAQADTMGSRGNYPFSY